MSDVILTVKLRDGREALAKTYKGNPCAKTFANRTQAINAARRVGVGWYVAHIGRPFYVVKRKLNLYVWEGVLCSYTDGMMCALATSPEHARKLILKKEGFQRSEDSIICRDLAKEPRVIKCPEGFTVWGSD